MHTPGAALHVVIHARTTHNMGMSTGCEWCTNLISYPRLAFPLCNHFRGASYNLIVQIGCCCCTSQLLFSVTLGAGFGVEYLQSSKIPPGRPVSKNLNVELFPVASLENYRLLGLSWSVQVALYQFEYIVLHRHSPDIPNPAEDFPFGSTSCVTPC